MIGSALESALEISGGVRLRRQIVEHARDAVAHVVRGRIDVAIQIELHRDARALVRARRAHLVDELDARDALLDHLRDLGLDDLRGGAAVVRVDGHDRRVDVRKLAHRLPQAGQRHEPDDDEHQAQNDGENGSADGKVGNGHGVPGRNLGVAPSIKAKGDSPLFVPRSCLPSARMYRRVPLRACGASAPRRPERARVPATGSACARWARSPGPGR